MLDEEKKADEAVSTLARSLYHKEKETIKNSREALRDLEDMKKKFGWNWNRGHHQN